MNLNIKNLNKSFGDKEVLKNINFSFSSNKIYGLIGRNGSGKTTFFNAINNDINVDSGEFLLNDKLVDASDIGYVHSTPLVPEFLTANEFLDFYLQINNKDNIDKEYYFDLVEINNDDRDKLLKDFSHGMKNKMELLINIISDPKIILLDEPLVSLDVLVQENIKKILKDLKKDHIIIFSTHILEIALDLCDEIVLLKDKKFELVEKNDLNNKKYKEKILKVLGDNQDD